MFFNAGVELLIEEGVWVGYTETAGGTGQKSMMPAIWRLQDYTFSPNC